MKLNGLSINIVRNEYEYNKYVAESYRKEYSWDDSKGSMPWIIIDFEKANSPTNQVSNLTLSSTPAADFTNISTAPNGEWSVGSDKTKLNINLTNCSRIMFEAKKDFGLTELPNSLTINVSDSTNNVISAATWNTLDLSDKAKLLEAIDTQCLQSGEGFLANLLYELIAQDKI